VDFIKVRGMGLARSRVVRVASNFFFSTCSFSLAAASYHCQGGAERLHLLAAPTKTIAKLVAVTAQVLFGNLVQCAVDSALQKAESVLHALRVIVTIHIGNYVIDHPMPSNEVIAANPAMRKAGIGLE
jgi:hypothetical protein